MKKSIFILFIAIAITNITYAQDGSFQRYFKNNTYWFPENVNIPREEVFATYKSNWGLTANDNMMLLTEEYVSALDAYLDRYAQYSHGFLIENSSVNVISKEGRVLYVDGFFIPNFHPNISNPMSESAALSSALTTINAPKYAWEDAALEADIKIVIAFREIDDTTTIADTTIDSSRTYYPTGTLVFATPYGDTSLHDTANYRLCWKFGINPMHLDTFITDTNTVDSAPDNITISQYRAQGELYAYVNTLTGEVYGIDPNVYGSGTHTGHINATLNDGNQSVNIWDRGWFTGLTGFRYSFDDVPRLVELMASSNFGTAGASLTDHDSWGGATGKDAYWQIEKSWDYYKNVHGLESTEAGNPHHQRIWLNQSIPASAGPSRTFYKYDHGWGDCYMIGPDVNAPDGTPLRAAFLDIMGHEYTHAIIFHRINVHPPGEAGAIIEAFCDFFGYHVAQYATGGYADLWGPDPGLARGFGHRSHLYSRHFPTPGSDYPSPSPAKYLEAGVWDGTNVYNMSGVLRHVFYLLNNGDSYNGITVPANTTVSNNLERDAYNIMLTFTAATDYNALADKFLTYYTHTYGSCSAETQVAYLAWKAVGIDHGDPCCNYNIAGSPITISGTTTWTSTNNPYTNATGVGATTISVGTDIIIAPGSSLTISGMTLCMGTGKYIKVNAATTSGGTGGRLVLDHAILTHNITGGCDASNSRWDGIRACGDPSFGQGSLSGSAQGVVNMSYSKIAYAVHGVQTAFTTTSDAGGIINAYHCDFMNNECHAVIFPYHNMSGSVEINGTYTFRNCSFICDNTVPVQPSSFISANTIKGLTLTNCEFSNNTGAAVTGGIICGEAKMSMSGCTFNNFERAIFDFSWSGSRAMNITSNTFNNNAVGIYVNGGALPYISNNTFNIPNPGTVSSYGALPGTTVYAINDQKVGVVISGTSAHYIAGNTFKTNATGTPGYYSFTTGIIAHNNGAANNTISGNTFTGLGVAMSSNFINNNASASSGLKFMCNKDTRTGYDIVVAGNNTHDGGVCMIQAANASGIGGAGNTFANSWHIYDQQKPIDYYYNSAVAAQKPINNYGSVTTHAASGDACGVIVVSSGGDLPYSIAVLGNQSSNKTLRKTLATANVNYYMMRDTVGRDSAYYWAGEIADPYGDLLITGMKIEDGATEEALGIYDNILTNYMMDDNEVNEFVVGRTLINMLISKRNGDQDMTSLDSNQVDSLVYVAEHTSTWAHDRAEGWLHMFDGRDLTNTLLYPGEDPDYMTPGNPGVLAVTEISNGPSGNCEYVELIATNCGRDRTPSVNIEGWIVDDNAGNFNTSGCGIFNLSTSIGHYKFAYTPLWENVPTGSRIILYNHDENCYNLPDVITVDSTDSANVYWVPIGGSVLAPYGKPYMDRYYTLPNLLQCNYCTDDYSIPPGTASSWVSTIGMRNAGDAIQVRCPGCDSLNPDTPAFYHGIGYGPETGTFGFSDILKGDNDLGGVVKYGSGTGNKYVFIGTSMDQLGNGRAWEVSPADAAGTVPSTLGNVSPQLQQDILGSAGIGDVDLSPFLAVKAPCCGGGRIRMRKVNPGDGSASSVKEVSEISVFPNPANTMLYFQFPSASKTTIRLMDVSGRVLKEQQVNNVATAQFSVKDFVPGIYMYQVITDSKTKEGKFIVEK